jgi:hypothetical protein
MNPVPTFPSVADAMAAVQAGLRFVAAADATRMSVQAQAEALQMMERANAIVTAARASVLSAFTSGQGYSADADYSPRAWLIHKTRVTNVVIVFALWYWDLDRGGAAVRALGFAAEPAFLFPEMSNPEHVRKGWYPAFVDYLHLSFNAAMAFSPTDVSAIKPWAKLMMMAEEAISVVVGILVVARAVNILR